MKIERALVICCHPDDEVLGIGGTIKKLTNQGTEVTVLMFANGNEGYTRLEDKDRIVEIRRQEREAVREILGIAHYEAYQYGDFAIPADDVTYKMCMKAIRTYRPDIVFTHYWNEYRTHKAVASITEEAFWQAGWSCSLELGQPWKAAALYHFEVIQLMPKNSFVVDISDTYGDKVKAMQAYASQCDAVVSDALQQIEGRALTRGAQTGVKYGEALLLNTTVPGLITDVNQLTLGLSSRAAIT
ncbi:PIG-L deacetylase family protein [Paenibacillus sp. GXUN7292]|uniref:PIG-L deacetylase family protein n=1 Tax=Paenibacillus sp. GXUN7292 TaxID=3422499 RepID=UPI003D7F064E